MMSVLILNDKLYLKVYILQLLRIAFDRKGFFVFLFSINYFEYET